MIGAVTGAFCGGGLTDKIIEYKARKNNGVYEPEFRLIALIIPFFIVPLGLLMYISPSDTFDDRYGLGVQHETHWIVPFIGFGGASFGLSSVNGITMAYSTHFKHFLL